MSKGKQKLAFAGGGVGRDAITLGPTRTSLIAELNRLDSVFAVDRAAMLAGKALDRPPELRALAARAAERMKRTPSPTA